MTFAPCNPLPPPPIANGSTVLWWDAARRDYRTGVVTAAAGRVACVLPDGDGGSAVEVDVVKLEVVQ